MAHYELIRRPVQAPTRLQRMTEALRSIWLGPYNPKDKELARLFGGTPAAAGIRVNEESSLTYAAVWNAVVLISGDIAKVPLPLYRRLPNGGKEIYREHPLYELLHDEPNPQMSSFVFRRTLTGHALVWGNGYAEIERDNSNRPVALWPLLPYAVTPFFERNVLQYRVHEADGGDVILPRRDVLHLSGLGLDGITGYPPIRKAMESLGLGIATERFGATFFGNGATFGGIISYPAGVATNPQTREENRKAIEGRHQGVDRAHRLLALYEGADYKLMGIPPDAAQFLETRRFQIEEVARWFNLPVHKLKELARSTNNNIEHQGIEYATDTLQPWFRMWEGELRLKLIPRLERKIQFFEHITEALTRGDSAAQGELASKQFSVGAATPNEIRNRYNYNPHPDGDDIYVPTNMMPAGIARKYWEAQIEATLAKAKPPEPQPQPQPEPESEEVKALRKDVEQARLAKQAAEDHADAVKAERDRVQADLIRVEAEAKWVREQDRQAYEIKLAAAQELVRTWEARTDTAQTQLTAAQQAQITAEAAQMEAQTRADALAVELQEKASMLQSLRDAAAAEAETLKTDLARARSDIAAELERQRTQRAVMLSAMRSLFVDASERLLQREMDRARKHQATQDKLRTWVESFYSLHADVCRSAFRPLVGPWTAMAGGAPNVLLERLVSEHIEASTQALRQVMDEDDPDVMAAALERTLRRWEIERSEAMADALVREGMTDHG